MRIGLLVSLVITFSSCNPCYVCKYTDDSGKESSTNEICDKRKELERFEADLEERWGSNGEVYCSNSPA